MARSARALPKHFIRPPVYSQVCHTSQAVSQSAGYRKNLLKSRLAMAIGLAKGVDAR
jgi:hypothetical protein